MAIGSYGYIMVQKLILVKDSFQQWTTAKLITKNVRYMRSRAGVVPVVIHVFRWILRLIRLYDTKPQPLLANFCWPMCPDGFAASTCCMPHCLFASFFLLIIDDRSLFTILLAEACWPWVSTGLNTHFWMLFGSHLQSDLNLLTTRAKEATSGTSRYHDAWTES